MTPIDALRQMAKAYPGGYESLAPRVGKSSETLRKELSGDPKFKLGQETASLISDICIAENSPHCYGYVNAVASDGGGFIRLPVREMTAPGCISRSLSAVTLEMSHVVSVTLDGNADNFFSDNDLDRALKEIGDAREALQELEKVVMSKHAADNQARGVIKP